jgi:hypothetical protein
MERGIEIVTPDFLLLTLVSAPSLGSLGLGCSHLKSSGSTFRVMMYTTATITQNRLNPVAMASEASMVMRTLQQNIHRY